MVPFLRCVGVGSFYAVRFRRQQATALRVGGCSVYRGEVLLNRSLGLKKEANF